MGQNIELREQIGVLSADMTLYHCVGSDGLSYWVKSKLNPNDRLAALLAREVKNDIGDMLDCVVSGIRLLQINEKRALQLPALNDTLSFQSALENASEFNKRLLLARSLATFVQELHNNDVVAGGLDPNSLFYYPEKDKFVTINSWNLATDGEHSPGLISDLQDYSNLVSISPEATGRTGRKPDKSSDLYSLGVLLYKVFTGEYPFDNDDPVALVHAHIARAHEFDPGLAYSIPEVILAIIDKLLDKEPEKRYPDIESLVRDLNEVISQLLETGGIRSFPIAKKKRKLAYYIS